MRTIIFQKMPTDLKLIWYRTGANGDLVAVLDFLKVELSAREDKHRADRRIEHPIKAKLGQPGSRNLDSKAINKPTAMITTAALLAGVAAQPRPVPANSQVSFSFPPIDCLFCDAKDYRSGACPWTLEERKAVLRKKNSCIICVRTGHKARECDPKRRWLKCNVRHHVFVCDADTKEDKDKTVAVRSSASMTAIPVCDDPDSDKILLKTTMVRLHRPLAFHPGRCILASGSQ